MAGAAARIAVVDYGMGNLRSVLNAFELLKADAELVADPDRLSSYDKVLLPGVGAFGQAIAHLRDSGMAQALDVFARGGKPLLGICLGMQLMCVRSSEDGEHEGLGWLDAQVARFTDTPGLKVPHMGWNSLVPLREHPVFEGVDPGSDCYFVHSYHVVPADPAVALAHTDHGGPFVSMVGRDNLLGMQFHPEKSQNVGLRLLANFVSR